MYAVSDKRDDESSEEEEEGGEGGCLERSRDGDDDTTIDGGLSRSQVPAHCPLPSVAQSLGFSCPCAASCADYTVPSVDSCSQSECLWVQSFEVLEYVDSDADILSPSKVKDVTWLWRSAKERATWQVRTSSRACIPPTAPPFMPQRAAGLTVRTRRATAVPATGRSLASHVDGLGGGVTCLGQGAVLDVG